MPHRLGVFSLSFPSFFRRLIDSITHPPTFRNSIASVAQFFFFFASLPLGYLHLLSVNLGLCTISGSAAHKGNITKASILRTVLLFELLDAFLLPFTFSSLQDASLYDLSLADPGKCTARFDDKS